ncbi:hypothetical protein Sjap_007933 [Stephania japonica]|uniref:Uncharacterized protein n=1 Tax=Stephania japonica TaxID=461633 RepID=A0AAP0JNY4_9MAGN
MSKGETEETCSGLIYFIWRRSDSRHLFMDDKCRKLLVCFFLVLGIQMIFVFAMVICVLDISLLYCHHQHDYSI